MADQIAEDSALSIRLREDGIHEMIVHEGSRAAVDAMFDYFLKTQAEYDGSRPLLYLILHQGQNDVPLNYAMHRSRQDLKHMPHPSRTVQVSPNRTLVHIVTRLMSNMPFLGNKKTRYMDVDQLDEAVAWLLSEE